MLYKAFLKRNIPGIFLRSVRKVGFIDLYILPPGKASLGNLNRTTPLSNVFGYDRGGPVDRYYIENFLRRNASSICGRVLKVRNNEYTHRFGGDHVSTSDVLQIDIKSAKGTFMGDLNNAPGF